MATAASATETKVVQRIPLPWAVSITVALALPFGLYLGKFNFTLWVSFIVWAEYFALGANVGTWKPVFPSIPAGALAAALWMATTALLQSIIGGDILWSMIIGDLIWVTILLYLIPRYGALTKGTLAAFNGLSLFLGVYFTQSMPDIGPMANPYWVVFLTFIWTTLMCYFGWLNVTTTFPKTVKV